jgi:hypothetical protein
LRRELAGDEVFTVTEPGSSGVQNGELLALAESISLQYRNHSLSSEKQSSENFIAVDACGERSVREY